MDGRRACMSNGFSQLFMGWRLKSLKNLQPKTDDGTWSQQSYNNILHFFFLQDFYVLAAFEKHKPEGRDQQIALKAFLTDVVKQV